MRSATRFVALCLLASLALLAASAPVAAKLRPITGKLSKPGYTVVALAADGRARLVDAPRGGFRIVPIASRVTLQLRAADGSYAGPIVVSRAGRRALVGVRAGARLGRILVRAGYAKLARALPRRFLDPRRWARARRGVPIGVRVAGRVRSRPPPHPVVGDLDADGFPDPLDIDDDGDLVFDNLERSAAAHAAQAQPELRLHTVLSDPNPESTTNANARQGSNPSVQAFSDDEIDAALAQRGDLMVAIIGGAAELDCTGLGYCTAGGTGTADVGDGLHLGAFPGKPFGIFDPDGDGFGTLIQQAGQPPIFHLHHGAATVDHGPGTAVIKTLQALTERVTANGIEQDFVGAVPEVLATSSAPASYDDGAGPGVREVGYPIQVGTNADSALPITDGADRKLDLTVTLWRPQRRPVEGEPGYGPPYQPGAWIDIGGLSYQVGVGGPDWGISRTFACPQSTLSDPGPGLTPAVLGGSPDQTGGFTDGALDQPADPQNRISYTVHLTDCLVALNSMLAASGSSEHLSWDKGGSRPMRFGVRDYGNLIQAGSHLWFKHE